MTPTACSCAFCAGPGSWTRASTTCGFYGLLTASGSASTTLGARRFTNGWAFSSAIAASVSPTGTFITRWR